MAREGASLIPDVLLNDCPDEAQRHQSRVKQAVKLAEERLIVVPLHVQPDGTGRCIRLEVHVGPRKLVSLNLQYGLVFQLLQFGIINFICSNGGLIDKRGGGC